MFNGVAAAAECIVWLVLSRDNMEMGETCIKLVAWWIECMDIDHWEVHCDIKCQDYAHVNGEYQSAM